MLNSALFKALSRGFTGTVGGCSAAGAAVPAELPETARRACASGLDTFRLGILDTSLSSVALRRACKSCKSLKPFVLATRFAFICGLPAFAVGAALLRVQPVRDRVKPGDAGGRPAPKSRRLGMFAPARLRLVVLREREGRPEGDAGICDIRLEAKGDGVGIDENVLLRDRLVWRMAAPPEGDGAYGVPGEEGMGDTSTCESERRDPRGGEICIDSEAVDKAAARAI